ncbi:MAG: hypothetical protein NTX11_04535 [Candidatus Saccharibacteria bacterium]|nr:hypothetical protein [Candidatus Saccharibacteria bacterium]
MPVTKNTKIKAKPPQTKGLQTKRKINKKIVALVTVVIAAIGALLLIFSHADVNGCTQLTDTDKKVYSVCSVRFLRGRDDSILLKSGSSEITSLKAAGFDQLGGFDYGNVFRAPDGPYKGAVPIYRVFNAGASLHDFVTASQRDQKSAVWKASSYVNEGIAFYAYETQVPGTVPVYRSYHKGSTFTLYTTDLAQRNAQVAQDGNILPGASDGLKYTGDIAFYVYPNIDCSKAENFYTPGCNDERTDLFTPPDVKKAAEDAAKAAAQAQIAATTAKTPEAKKAATVATTTAKKAQQTAKKSGQKAASKNKKSKTPVDTATLKPAPAPVVQCSTGFERGGDFGKCVKIQTGTNPGQCRADQSKNAQGECIATVPLKDCKISYIQDGYTFLNLAAGTFSDRWTGATQKECDGILIYRAKNRKNNGFNRERHDFKEYWGGKYIRSIK